MPRGAGGRYALGVLRKAKAPLTAYEIAQKVLLKLGKTATDEAVGMMGKTVHSTLGRRKDGAVKFDASTQPERLFLTYDELLFLAVLP